MPEGLSTSEVGSEIAEHAKRTHEGEPHGRRHAWVTLTEALLLSLVAVVAAYSGYSSAKWGTESSVSLAKASATRTKANRADLEALSKRNFDASTFNAWFSAYVAGNEGAMRLAVKRFTPTFRAAFDAWQATHPATNPHAPKGPTYMPQYRQPQAALARSLDARADGYFAEGVDAGATSDKYVRLTIYLATVLFLVGISGQFRLAAARYSLIGVGVALLVFSLVELGQLPRPP